MWALSFVLQRLQEMKNTYLLKLEDALVDVILQSLVGVVDTQLLKTVWLEVLKSKHIQDTDGQTLKIKTTNRLIHKQHIRVCKLDIVSN